MLGERNEGKDEGSRIKGGQVSLASAARNRWVRPCVSSGGEIVREFLVYLRVGEAGDMAAEQLEEIVRGTAKEMVAFFDEFGVAWPAKPCFTSSVVA